MSNAGRIALLVLALGAALVAVQVQGGAEDERRNRPFPVPSVTLAEDDPGWDCATMGNRTCGPSAVPSRKGR